MKHFDLIIIGSGAGGIAAALRAEELKLKTLLVNEGLPLGGTCLNVGCIPCKLLLHSAQIAHVAQKRIEGITVRLEQLNFEKIIKDSRDFIEQWRSRDQQMLENLSHVTYKKGWASFISPTAIRVAANEFSADVIIIATGSKAITPSLEGLQEVGFLTHEDLFSLSKLPESTAIIGAGPFGLECAQLLNRFGSKIVLLEQGAHIFKRGDKDLTAILRHILEDEGITIKMDITLQKAYTKEGAKCIEGHIKGVKQEIIAHEIVIATGKHAQTQALNLQWAEVALDIKGSVVVDRYCQTSQPHIFAIGDVTNAPMRLESTSAQEGRYAVDNAFLKAAKSIDYSSVPYAFYTDPPYAYVGISEEEALAQSDLYAVLSLPLDQLTYATICGYREGLVKMIVNKKTAEICGMHMLGPGSPEVISHVVSLMHNHVKVDAIADSLFIFPTFSQAIKLLALQFRPSE